jgi:hypothetical protein
MLTILGIATYHAPSSSVPLTGSSSWKRRRESAAPSSSTRVKRPPTSICGVSGQKIEVAGEHGAYTVPPHRRDYAAVVLSLARQETPDMSAYIDPEIKTRILKHAGLVLSSPDPDRVEHLIREYTERFYRDFFATMPPPERPLE